MVYKLQFDFGKDSAPMFLSSQKRTRVNYSICGVVTGRIARWSELCVRSAIEATKAELYRAEEEPKGKLHQ